MMSLTIREIIVLGLIGIIFILANILVVAKWMSDTGIAERADWLSLIHEIADSCVKSCCTGNCVEQAL